MTVSKISIIIPCYNEENTVDKLIHMVLLSNIGKIKKEIIVINDGSTDNTRQKLIKFVKYKNIKIINKKKNEGKGAAIKSGLSKASGDIVIIQDADLEYNPSEYNLLINPIIKNKADVVFGSRFIGGKEHRVLLFWHMLGNKILTLISNMVTNLNLTDMETCYKVFTKNVANQLHLKEERFGFEPEFTTKVAKMDVKIFEVGISYSGRGYSEGKKINWKDGLYALWCLFKYKFL